MMSFQILIPTPLRQFTNNQESVTVEGKSVGEGLKNLCTRHSALQKHLYSDDGRLRNFVNIYVNDEDIRYLQKEATQVAEKDVVSIIPSIAGGRE
ncbi:MAG TPA: MoaD/ThiS family protein [Bacteroidota bacterium]|nr:MoaD/ThiS family protein [Bacteroidota bacterium]